MNKPYIYRSLLYNSNWWMVTYPLTGRFIRVPVWHTKPFATWESAVKFALDKRRW